MGRIPHLAHRVDGSGDWVPYLSCCIPTHFFMMQSEWPISKCNWSVSKLLERFNWLPWHLGCGFTFFTWVVNPWIVWVLPGHPGSSISHTLPLQSLASRCFFLPQENYIVAYSFWKFPSFLSTLCPSLLSPLLLPILYVLAWLST